MSLPISVDLESIRALAEEAVPRSAGVNRYDSSFYGGAGGVGITARYGVDRGPLSVTWRGGRLYVSAELTYWIDGRVRLGVPIEFGCGTNGEPPRRAKMRVVMSPRIDSSWELRTETRLEALEPHDRCRITALGLDVTDRIFERFREELAGSLRRIDAEITHRVALRQTITRAWELMASPVALGEGGWLVMGPRRIGLAPLEGDGRALSTTLRVLARPRVVLGAEPRRSVPPLPRPSDLPDSGSFRVEVPVDVSYEPLEFLAKAQLEAAIRSYGLPASGPSAIVVRSVEIRGRGPRIQAHVRLEGPVEGSIFVEATPELDAAENRIRFPDLVIRSQASGLPPSVLENEAVREQIRARFEIDLAPTLARARERIAAALNRQSGRATMTATIEPPQLLGISLEARRAVRVLVAVEGALRLEVRSGAEAPASAARPRGRRRRAAP